ncbi:MAG: hypothetical protein R3B96_07480 [Pirellulaceae bacterium]
MRSPDDAPNEELAAEAVPGLSAAEGSGDESVLAKYVPRPWRILIGIGFGLYAVLLIGDFGYAAYVGSAVSRFEQDLVFDSEGVREGAKPTREAKGIPQLYSSMGSTIRPASGTSSWSEPPPRDTPVERCVCLVSRNGIEITRGTRPWNGRGRRGEVADEDPASQGRCRWAFAGGALAANRWRNFQPREVLRPTSRRRNSPPSMGSCWSRSAIDVANDRSPVLRVRQWHSISRALAMFTDSTASPFRSMPRIQRRTNTSTARHSRRVG